VTPRAPTRAGPGGPAPAGAAAPRMRATPGGRAYPGRTMAGPSFRDRMISPRVLPAAASPWSLALLVAVVVVAVAAGAAVPYAVLLGVAAYVVAVLVVAARPVRPRPERIDPFTVHDPWRRSVQEAVQARSRFDELVHRMPEGPLRDTLATIAGRMHVAVREHYRIAQQGQALSTARRTIDLDRLDRQQAELTTGDGAEGADDADEVTRQVIASLDAQRQAAARLDRVQADAQNRLRLLDARIDEALARAVELSARSRAAAEVDTLGSDVESLVTDMEALRQALEEVHEVGGGLASPGGPS
jgi:hypothetical protein